MHCGAYALWRCRRDWFCIAIALLVYQAVLYAAGMLLPNGEAAFTYAVLAYVGLVEVVAYIVLLTAHRLAVSAGLLGPNAVEVAV